MNKKNVIIIMIDGGRLDRAQNSTIFKKLKSKSMTLNKKIKSKIFNNGDNDDG